MTNEPITIFWFRRDLRLNDNAGLYHALKQSRPVLPIFIFDKAILDELEDRNDARVTFIHQTIEELQKELHKLGSSLLILYDTLENAWDTILKDHNVASVYTNHDYEPYAKTRDAAIGDLSNKHNIELKT